jgi:hypothetical protein
MRDGARFFREKLPTLAQYLGQRLSLDLLHREVVLIAVAAETEETHGIWSIESQRDARFSFEVFHLFRVVG